MAERRDPMDRFIEKVNKAGPLPSSRPDLGPCWLWTAATDGRGYGAFGTIGTRVAKAHKWLWEQENGPVPQGLELDHLCRVTLCVRPDHLEPVTHGENISRARKARTICTRGHDMVGPTADVRIRPRDDARICRHCERINRQAWLDKRGGDPRRVEVKR